MKNTNRLTELELQEEAIWYIEGLKNSPDGSKSIFGIYDKVYVTGHSKGGN